MVERERSLEESREAIQAKLIEIHSEKEHVTYALDQTLKKLQYELQDINSVGFIPFIYFLFSPFASFDVPFVWSDYAPIINNGWIDSLISGYPIYL